jgi:hypothetical protein
MPGGTLRGWRSAVRNTDVLIRPVKIIFKHAKSAVLDKQV